MLIGGTLFFLSQPFDIKVLQMTKACMEISGLWTVVGRGILMQG
jgi:hypothetical protein